MFLSACMRIDCQLLVTRYSFMVIRDCDQAYKAMILYFTATRKLIITAHFLN